MKQRSSRTACIIEGTCHILWQNHGPITLCQCQKSFPRHTPRDNDHSIRFWSNCIRIVKNGRIMKRKKQLHSNGALYALHTVRMCVCIWHDDTHVTACWSHSFGVSSYNVCPFNTLRPRQMDAIWQTIFSSAFSWMKMFEFLLKFHWSLFLRVELTIFHHWFR